jgi:hypothetical protein
LLTDRRLTSSRPSLPIFISERAFLVALRRTAEFFSV